MTETGKQGTGISFPRSLKYEVGVSLAVALTLAVGIFTFLMLRHQRNALLMEAVRHVDQVSEIVLNSARSAMIHNRSDQVREIIRDIGRSQVVITKVRILKKDGTILYSCCDHEIAKRIDREAEACILCHGGSEPRLKISLAERVRIFRNPEGGGRSLGMINIIRNEPACSTAECHVHSPERKILGILDVVYSLEEIDRQRSIESLTIAGFSLGIVVMASLLGLFVVQRRIYLPLRDLEQGAKRLARGELEEEIPVRRPDELGHLASSLNHMMKELAFSDRQLQEWNQTLEERVDEKTEELRIAEGKTAQAEKLASVGLLAAGVAHELNNPLTGVLTFSSLMRQKMAEGSLEAQDRDLIIRETRRCSAIIKRLLDFAREERPEKRHVDINDLIGETVKIVSHSASTHDIETELDLAGDIPPPLDRQGADQAGGNQPAGECHRRHRGEGDDPHRHRSAPRPPLSRGGRGSGAHGGSSHLRHGKRHLEGTAVEALRSFFHHQGVREGHRARTLCNLRHRQGSPWPHRRKERRGGGHDFLRASPPGAGRKGGLL